MAVAIEPHNLAARLRSGGLEERVAALLHHAVIEACGAEDLQAVNPAACDRLVEVLRAPARQAAANAVNRLVFEVLATLDEEPALRSALARAHPELGQH